MSKSLIKTIHGCCQCGEEGSAKEVILPHLTILVEFGIFFSGGAWQLDAVHPVVVCLKYLASFLPHSPSHFLGKITSALWRCRGAVKNLNKTLHSSELWREGRFPASWLTAPLLRWYLAPSPLLSEERQPRRNQPASARALEVCSHAHTHTDMHTCTLCHSSPSPSSSWRLRCMWQVNKINNCGCCCWNKAKTWRGKEQQEQRQQRHSKSVKSGQVRGRNGANLVRLIPLAPSETAWPCWRLSNQTRRG